jgi:hypothetical protein
MLLCSGYDDYTSWINGKSRRERPSPSEALRPPRNPGECGFSSIYLNEQDQRLLRDLSLWFAGQGLRINDTLVLRIALRAARPGSALLAAYEEAVKSDRRFKKTQGT